MRRRRTRRTATRTTARTTAGGAGGSAHRVQGGAARRVHRSGVCAVLEQRAQKPDLPAGGEGGRRETSCAARRLCAQDREREWETKRRGRGGEGVRGRPARARPRLGAKWPTRTRARRSAPREGDRAHKESARSKKTSARARTQNQRAPAVARAEAAALRRARRGAATCPAEAMARTSGTQSASSARYLVCTTICVYDTLGGDCST